MVNEPDVAAIMVMATPQDPQIARGQWPNIPSFRGHVKPSKGTFLIVQIINKQTGMPQHWRSSLSMLDQHKNSRDICTLIVNEVRYTIPTPTAPVPQDENNPTAAEQVQLWLFEKRLNMLIKCETFLYSNIQCLYYLVLGQCMDLLQTKLKQQATWTNVNNTQDGIALLGLIKTVTHHF